MKKLFNKLTQYLALRGLLLFSASNLLETGMLGLLMTNAALANVGDAGGLQPSVTAGSFYCSLTVSPGHTEAGDQTTNETAYTNYARVAIARSVAAWTVTNDVCDNDSVVTFATCGATGATIFGFGLGSASAAAGNLHLIGDLTATLAVSNGVTPSFAAGALDIVLA